MARYKWLVFSNCTAGDDDVFNRWYDEVHIPDLLRIPGVVGAQRSKLASAHLRIDGDGGMNVAGPEAIGARFGYLAIYLLDTDNPEAVLNEVVGRANTPEMVLSPTLGEVWTVLYEDR